MYSMSVFPTVLAPGSLPDGHDQNLTGVDPETDQIVPLFNPRHDAHSEQFAVRGPLFVGLTPVPLTHR